MGIKSFFARPFAYFIARSIRRDARCAVRDQEKIFRQIVRDAQNTAFGKDHRFDEIHRYEDFRERVPIRDYEGIKPYIERIKSGELDVLWKGRPKYFAKTSGTTSGVKYIPITRESLPNHFGTARNALFNYIAETGNTAWLDGKLIFLSGSPELEDLNGIPTGRLSGISNHLIPKWLKTSQMPSYKTNCIEDWEEKLDRIVEETCHKNMTFITGIPPWVQMYYERLIAHTGKSTVKEVFPNYSVFAYGGVNYDPYRAKLEALVGAPVDSVETYPASEGFIAFQDQQSDPGLLLNSNSGIFFEFVPVDEIARENPTRLTLGEVETGKNYALIINSNAGLWGYSIGDTVSFVSTKPYRLIVTGRVKHFISAFGEHVIGKEVEEAMHHACTELGVTVVEFTVAPQVNPPEGGLPYHEWLVEFDTLPGDLTNFAARLDFFMTQQNIYYQDLIEGHILQPLKIVPLGRDAFRNYMKSLGKLGGQNKVPRLSNDRKIAGAILSLQ
jgi:hypothetical protein